MTEPTRADQVILTDERTEDEKRRQQQRRVVQTIRARQAAVRAAGGTPPAGSAGNVGTLQERLARRDRERYERFKGEKT